MVGPNQTEPRLAPLLTLARDDPDAALVDAALRNSTAFGPLYQRYQDPIYRYCLRRLGDKETAQDATSPASRPTRVQLSRRLAKPLADSMPLRMWTALICLEFGSRLWENLMQTQSITLPVTISAKSANALRTIREMAEGSSDLSPPIQGLRHHRMSLTLAAALVLAMIGSVARFWYLNGDKTNRLVNRPAILAPGTPTPDHMTPRETLFEITLPADGLPIG